MITQAIISQATGLITRIGERTITRGLNEVLPDAIPSLDEAIDHYLRGRYPRKDLITLAKWHGVNLDAQTAPGNLAGWWWSIIDRRKDYLSPAELLTIRQRGAITEEEFMRLLTHARAWGGLDMDAWLRTRYSPYDMGTLGELLRRGRVQGREQLERHLQALGWGPRQYDDLIDVMYSQLDQGTIVERWRRDQAQRKQAVDALGLLGMRPGDAETILDTSTPLLDPGSLATLWRRQIITREQAEAGTRKQGWSAVDAGRILDLSEQRPPAAEVLAMYRVKTDDAKLNGKYGRDDGTPQIGVGTLGAWLAAAGVTREQVEQEWRLGWSMPGPQEVIAAMIRLRPDAPITKDGGAAAGLSVTATDVAEIQEMSGVPSWWRKRQIAMAYTPLGRRELLMGYRLGTVSDDQMRAGLQDQGYSPASADALMPTYRAQREAAIDKLHPVAEYERGVISSAEATASLTAAGLDGALIADAISRATERAEWSRRAKCVAALRSRYMDWEWDQATTIVQLQQLGLDQMQAAQTASTWQCERDAVSKEVPLTKLLAWYTQGVISRVEYAVRLGRMGYPPVDAQRLLSEADGELIQIKARAKAKALAAANVAQRQRERERQQIRTQLKQQMAAARKLAIYWGISISQAGQYLQEEIDRLVRNQNVELGDAVAIVVGTANASKGTKRADFTAAVNATLAAERDLVRDAATEAATGE